MVFITDEATAVLDDIRNQAIEQMDQIPDGVAEPGLRLLIQEDQAALTLDVPHASDQVLERDGHPVLLIDPEVGSLIDGATVDIQHATDGDRLVIEQRDELDEQQ